MTACKGHVLTGWQMGQQSHHVGGNLIRGIAIKVKLEGHHLVVMRLQLALDHLVPCVAYLWGLWGSDSGCTGAPKVGHPPATGPLTLRIVSRGRLAFSGRERTRVDLR